MKKAATRTHANTTGHASSGPRPTSPYTGKTVDQAIVHLERVLATNYAIDVLGIAYWQGRVTELAASPALTPMQRVRVARLPDRLTLRRASS